MFENNLNSENCFDLYETSFVPEQEITTGSNYMFGNGYMGYRGTHPDATKENYAACIVTDTYDNADGKWQELCNVPNGLYLDIVVNGQKVSAFGDSLSHYKRRIDIETAKLTNEFSTDDVAISVERFASMDQIHILSMRLVLRAKQTCDVVVTTGINGDVWSINGEHFSEYNLSEVNGGLLMHSVTKELHTDIYVAEKAVFQCGAEVKENIDIGDKQVFRKVAAKLTPETPLVLEKFVAIYSSNDTDNPKELALDNLASVQKDGYQNAAEKHDIRWQALWDKYDIKIAGNDRDQTLTRFNLYHNIIHTPTHALLPIGARGLSCQAYQGAAFWDQEVFNLPMYLYTDPEIARNVLRYRYETLNGARRKARKLGYRGAFYAWISGKTGDELCPDFFFKDIVSGRKIRNHFNCWQIHVSPDVAYTIWKYYEVTGDKEFLHQYGAEMMLDISLFLLSRSFYNVDKDRYEYIRLLGPDEYHENVDNNIFTNYQARYTLQKTIEVYEQLTKENPSQLAALMNKLDISEETVNTFRHMIEKMYIQPINENGVIEQFDGYFGLEDVTPEELATRLIDKAEYWGWPNGVAVHTQVLKQADLVQLFVMHDDFDEDVVKANFDYYEPRTEHGSSLSPAMHSVIASKIGYDDFAYRYFVKSCTVDLYNTNKAISGGTFIGGIHTASCGAVWQMVVFGFAGFSVSDDTLHFKPALPAEWDECSFRVNHKANIVDVKMSRECIVLEGHKQNMAALRIDIGGHGMMLEPGQSVSR